MENFLFQKAQEMSFALLRVSAYIRRFELRKKMETLGYHLLENISYENYDLALNTITTIRNFVILGKNIYEIEPVNARILLQQLDILSEELQERAGIEGELDLGDIFSKEDLASSRHPEPAYRTGRHSEARLNSQPARQESRDPRNDKTIEKKGSDPQERQQKIISLLGNNGSGNLRLRDISNQFPDVTARTIRNDLRELVEKGVVSREGSGPSSTYTGARTTQPAPETGKPAQEADQPSNSGTQGVINL